MFQSKDVDIVDCTFADGESPLKESKNLFISNSLFRSKYPLWYCSDIEVADSTMLEMAGAGIWYTNRLSMRNTTIQAPKAFRQCSDLILEKVHMPHAAETLWHCKEIFMRAVTAAGDYFAMNSQNIMIDGFTLVGNYSFDGAKNLTIRNARMLTKDVFWNCVNVTVYDSFISGEYLGWNSKNITLINCTIESEQRMCYMENVVMKNCRYK